MTYQLCDWDLEREQHCTPDALRRVTAVLGILSQPSLSAFNFRHSDHRRRLAMVRVQLSLRLRVPIAHGAQKVLRAFFSLYTSSYPRHGIESLILAFHGVMIFDHCVPVFIFPLSTYFSSLCIHAKAANQQHGLPLTEHCLPPSSGDGLRFFGTLLDFLYKRSG